MSDVALSPADRPPFMVLGLDSGATSGVALAYLRSSGPALAWTDSGKSTPEFRRLWVESAVRTAEVRGAHLMVVYERFFGKPHTIRGAAKQVGRWLHVLEECGVRDTRMREVAVHQWRLDVHGHNRRIGTDAWKRLARQWCQARYGLDIEHDAAEAACLAVWGLSAQQVLTHVPKRARRPA